MSNTSENASTSIAALNNAPLRVADSGSSFRYGGASGRRMVILQQVRQRGYVAFGELSELLEVSDRTIRRDLDALELDGQLEVVVGGAALAAGTYANSSFHTRSIREAETKRELAKVARTLVTPDDVVGIDAGTTASFVAGALVDIAPLTVISHSLEVINQFSGDSGAQLIAVGGSYDSDRRAFLGPMTRACLEGLLANISFLSCSGVHANGFACATQADAEIKQALLGIATRRVLVATSSVFDRIAPVRVVDFKGISTLISDNGLRDEARQRLETEGVEVIIAPLLSEQAPIEPSR